MNKPGRKGGRIPASLLAGILLISVTGTVFGQESTAPVPYTEDEFPQWAKDLRRFEIVFLGSTPFTFLYTTVGYSLFQLAASGFDFESVPTFFSGTGNNALDETERIGLLLTSLGISAVIAVVDLIIINIKRDREASLDTR